MKQLLKLFDYIFVLRPVFLYPVWMIFLAGYYLQADYASAAVPQASNGTGSASPGFLLAGLALTCLMGAIFALNQVMDRNSTRAKNTLSLIAPDKLTPKSAFIEASVLLAVAIILAFVFSLAVGMLALVILLTAGFLYNFSPFNWKDKPALALLTTGIATMLIFVIGWLVRGPFDQQATVAAVPYILTIIAVSMYATPPLAAMGGTQETSPGKEKYQRTPALYAGLLFEVVALVVAFVLRDELIFYPILFSLPFFIWALTTLDRIEIDRAMKYPILLLGLAISFKWTLTNSNYHLFFVILAIYLLSKLYYRLRFGVNYPSLSGSSVRV